MRQERSGRHHPPQIAPETRARKMVTSFVTAQPAQLARPNGAARVCSRSPVRAALAPARPYVVAPNERYPVSPELWQFQVDAAGYEIPGGTLDGLVAAIEEGDYDDVVIVSHGWNIRQEDGKGAFGSIVYCYGNGIIESLTYLYLAWH